jgi:hypothetical protein
MQNVVKTLSAIALLSVGLIAQAADVYGLTEGTPDLQSIGPIAFGPDGILLAGDNKGAAVFALRTGDTKGDAAKATYNIADISGKVAAALGAKPDDVKIEDLAVNPLSGNLYLAASVGGKSALVKVDAKGVSQVPLDGIAFAKLALPNPPKDDPGARRNPRASVVTDIAFVDGSVLLTGMTAKDAPSSIRSVSFPFDANIGGASLEIYHAAHGKVESGAPARTIVPIMIDGQPNILAGYVCTPLVKFPLGELKGGEKVRGTTVAELGNMNQPLDMIAYKKDGKDFLLLTNSARGVMKISTDGIASNKGLNDPVGGGGTAGQTYETIDALKGTTQMDQLNDGHAVVIQGTDLKTVALP